MKYSQIKKLLESLKFSNSGKIKLDGSKLFYGPNLDVVDKGPHVYCWVLNSGNESDILYVGKAGKGIVNRMNQHKGGFVRSKSGKQKAQVLRRKIKDGEKIAIYARDAKSYFVNGCPEKIQVNGASLEEDAFIHYFKKSFGLELNKTV